MVGRGTGGAEIELANGKISLSWHKECQPLERSAVLCPWYRNTIFGALKVLNWLLLLTAVAALRDEN